MDMGEREAYVIAEELGIDHEGAEKDATRDGLATTDECTVKRERVERIAVDVEMVLFIDEVVRGNATPKISTTTLLVIVPTLLVRNLSVLGFELCVND